MCGPFLTQNLVSGCCLLHSWSVVCPQEMLNEARERLATIAKDPARYPALMDGLLLQVCGATPAAQI